MALSYTKFNEKPAEILAGAQSNIRGVVYILEEMKELAEISSSNLENLMMKRRTLPPYSHKFDVAENPEKDNDEEGG